MKYESIASRGFGRLPGPVSSLLAAFLRFRPVYRLAELATAVRYVVQGDSMQPSFSRDQYILVSRLAYRGCAPSRGDVVVLRHPVHWYRHYIKRIVGLPGERVRTEGGRVYIGGHVLEQPYFEGHVGSRHDVHLGLDAAEAAGPMEMLEKTDREWFVGEDEYFVMGDNRANSNDSRSLGPLPRELIVGKAWISYWPRSSWGVIR